MPRFDPLSSVVLVLAATAAWSEPASRTLPPEEPQASSVPSIHAMGPGRIDLPDGGVTVAMGRLSEARATVQVMLDGRGPYVFAVETGARIVQVNSTVADELQLPNVRLGKGVDSTAAAAFRNVDSLRIGNLVLRDLPVVVGPQYLPGADGLLGLPAYGEILLTLDYPAQQLRFERGALPVPNGQDILPIVPLESLVGVELLIAGRPTATVIDTQSGSALDITPGIADSLQFVAPPVQTGAAGIGGHAPVPVKSARLQGDVRIGAVTIQRPILGIVRWPPGFPKTAVLGSDLLRHFVVTLDQKNGRVRFTGPELTLAPPPPLRVLGLSLTPQPGGGVSVTSVRDAAPAQAAGLRAGDEVVQIAGRPARDFSQPEVLRTLVRAGGSIHFEVRRNGAPMAFDITPAELVP